VVYVGSFLAKLGVSEPGTRLRSQRPHSRSNPAKMSSVVTFVHVKLLGVFLHRTSNISLSYLTIAHPHQPSAQQSP
jgi:hypothetical protein